MTDNHTQAAPFETPFRLLDRPDEHAAEVLDRYGYVISSLLSPDRAQWLCDRLNAAAPSEGGNYVLVPREPTEAMVLAAEISQRGKRWDPTEIYCAMLFAAPPAPDADPRGARNISKGIEMSRNIIDAALRLSKATPEEIQTIAAHDWDMIREVAAMFLADRREALLKDAREKPYRTCSHGAPI